jgi:Icc-related predicted phosphoesterase
VRLLALADEPPAVDPSRLVRANDVDAVVTLGDLSADSIAPLASVEVPVLGVHGNHDDEGDFAALGVRDLHLSRVELDGWSFTGFEGCVRYREGVPYQYTQREAARLARHMPRADVLLCHAPPRGVNDDPDDPAHVGFQALRAWVLHHEPAYVLHGHSTPDPRTRVYRLGRTQVIWVRGARIVELDRAKALTDSS